MCSPGSVLDELTFDCIPAGSDSDVSTKVLIESVTLKPVVGVKVCGAWIALISVTAAVLVAAVMIVVVISVYLQKRKSASQRADVYVEAAAVFDNLNEKASRMKTCCPRGNRSNSQMMTGISKDSVVKRTEEVYSELDNGKAKNYAAENTLGTEYTKHSFPLPATELGPTVLVTTKTFHISGDHSNY
ncbi:uncharacterized protein LOC144611485 [Rhinoraja longicauda]